MLTYILTTEAYLYFKVTTESSAQVNLAQVNLQVCAVVLHFIIEDQINRGSYTSHFI